MKPPVVLSPFQIQPVTATVCLSNGASTTTQWALHRAGMRECIWQESLDLLLPEYVLEGWTTTLPEKLGASEIIALYCDHATHEQFGKTPSQHSEFKSDMDLERLPSGKFDTNYLLCQLAALAMNLLRQVTPWGPAQFTERGKVLLQSVKVTAPSAGRFSAE